MTVKQLKAYLETVSDDNAEVGFILEQTDETGEQIEIVVKATGAMSEYTGPIVAFHLDANLDENFRLESWTEVGQ
jgi:hypothetical protein